MAKVPNNLQAKSRIVKFVCTTGDTLSLKREQEKTRREFIRHIKSGILKAFITSLSKSFFGIKIESWSNHYFLFARQQLMSKFKVSVIVEDTLTDVRVEISTFDGSRTSHQSA